MSFSLHTPPLPENALLQRFVDSGDYTDCFATHVDCIVGLETFIEAFYTTTVFKAERLILGWLASMPSTDSEARQIARAERDAFAAWNMFERTSNQLLMMDVRGQTCSWFMVAPTATGSQLYFGSAVMRNQETPDGPRMKWTYKVLLGFHRLYSRVLLRAASKRVLRIDARSD